MFLVADSDADALLAHRRMLYANNILSLGSDYRDLPRYSDIAELEAMIVTNPYDKNLPMHFPYTCHTRYPKTPIVGFRQQLRSNPADIGGYDILIDVDLPPRKFMDIMLMEISRYHGRDIADHMSGSARDHILMPYPTWGGNPFPLTKTERMIYRYLIDTSPRLVSPIELLRYCMKPGTNPLLCNIATHIYHINQKAKEIFGIPLIHCPGNIGYQLIP